MYGSCATLAVPSRRFERRAGPPHRSDTDLHRRVGVVDSVCRSGAPRAGIHLAPRPGRGARGRGPLYLRLPGWPGGRSDSLTARRQHHGSPYSNLVDAWNLVAAPGPPSQRHAGNEAGRHCKHHGSSRSKQAGYDLPRRSSVAEISSTNLLYRMRFRRGDVRGQTGLSPPVSYLYTTRAPPAKTLTAVPGSHCGNLAPVRTPTLGEQRTKIRARQLRSSATLPGYRLR